LLLADVSSPDPLDPCYYLCELQLGGAFSGLHFEKVVMFDTRSIIDDFDPIGGLAEGVGNMVISSVPESVPEPKTSVMMITALGLLGLVGGRIRGELPA